MINDQAEYFTDPNSTSSAGSDASLSIRVTMSLFEGNGFSTLDRDGLRVNEGGNGGLDAVIRNSRFVGNGADGLELDERAAGDAAFSVQRTDFQANGFFSSDSDGALDARLQRPVSSNNAGAGVALEQAPTGTGQVRIQRLMAAGNADGPVKVSGTVTVVQ